MAAEKGILEMPEPKKGRTLSQEIEDSVKLFYEDDEFSKMMPGSRDHVCIARNVHKQKRLLLCNLKVNSQNLNCIVLTRRSILIIRLGSQSFVSCVLNGASLFLHLALILYVFAKYIKIPNQW